MKERPILFSGAMVRAILEGRKTHTRRVIDAEVSGPNHPVSECPYGKPGGRLWVREAWKPHVQTSVHSKAIYRAEYSNEKLADALGKWKPSIHMPRWASRLTLEIVKVRVERLQEISEEDAIAEGVTCDGGYYCEEPTEEHDGVHRCNMRVGFQALWESINSKLGHGWESNPWVWVIEFKQVEP